MRPHPRRAATDPSSPRAWATCDRSGFITNHEKLVRQFEWRGEELNDIGFLIAPDMIDIPQRQLGTLVLQPDPVSVLNARPESYEMEESTHRITQDGTQRYQMDGTQRLLSNLQDTISLMNDDMTLFLTDDRWNGNRLVDP